MSQCHTYTAAPARGAEPLAVSSTCSWMVRGTPWARPLAEPKLGRMSRRTIPLWVSTLGPFDPSPGKGPAVSSGMGVAVSPAAVAGVVAAVVAVVAAVVAVVAAG